MKKYIIVILFLCILAVVLVIIGLTQKRPIESSEAVDVPVDSGEEAAAALPTAVYSAEDEVSYGFHTVEGRPDEMISQRHDENVSISLVVVSDSLPPIEVMHIYSTDPETGERQELMEKQVIFANLASIRLRYGADDSPLLQKARQIGALIYASPASSDEEYVFSLPDVKIGGHGEGRSTFLDMEEVIRVLPVWVSDPAIRERAISIAEKNQ